MYTDWHLYNKNSKSVIKNREIITYKYIIKVKNYRGSNYYYSIKNKEVF